MSYPTVFNRETSKTGRNIRYKRAFDAVEMARVPGPQGKLIHACIRIGDSVVMLVDEFPEWSSFGPKSLKGSPVTIHLQVEDVDAVFERAVGVGAKIKMPLADMFWGDRYGKLEDPFGHHWSVATHIREVRQLFELEDFGQSEAIERFRDMGVGTEK